MPGDLLLWSANYHGTRFPSLLTHKGKENPFSLFIANSAPFGDNAYVFTHSHRNVLNMLHCPVNWGCRIHRLLFCNEYPAYDTQKSKGEVPMMIGLWGMQSTPSLPSLPCPLWPRVVAPDRAQPMGQTDLNYVLMQNWITLNITVLISKLRTYAFLNFLK